MIKQFMWLFKTIYQYLLVIVRDLKGIRLFVGSKLLFRKFERQQSNVYNEFEKIAKRQPQKACIIFNDKTWTFKDMYDYSNHIACVFMKKFNLKKGDCVALFMENKPEYVGIWLGLSKLGVITALINSNLKNDSLLHCIDVANSCVVIFDSALEQSIETVRGKLKKEVRLVIQGDEAKVTNALSLETLFAQQPLEIVESAEKVKPSDTMIFIYTSGTTGLPKPAIMKHNRFYGAAVAFFRAAGLTTDDVVMVTLPIYHGNGGMLGMGTSVLCGATVVLRKKFSASNFWKECIQYNCTAFVYVGEICRFLVNQPPSPLDRQHKVRVAYGNGMRANIWHEFKQRFGVNCCEFYAASEGNCTLINLTQRTGACGFIPLISKFIRVYPVYIIKIDENMNPIRDEQGRCIKCHPGEKGLLIGVIGTSPEKSYTGYANSDQASSKKIIPNVFKQGQNAFNSGDLMMMDKYGYVYFCDRLGDTFRWKGENVSTIEVENIISKHLNSKEVVVYGVEIPGQEGRAGMAAIHVDPESMDLKSLAKKLKVDLPAYAKPMFIRFAQELEHTGTFKATKLKLVKDAFNVNIVQDPIYYFDSKEDTYNKLTPDVYENILKGIIRF